MAPFLLLLAHPPYLEPTKQTNSISPSQAFVKIEFSASSLSLLGSPSLGVTEEDEEGERNGNGEGTLPVLLCQHCSPEGSGQIHQTCSPRWTQTPGQAGHNDRN